MSRKITVEATWRGTYTFEVADDYEAPNESRLELGEDTDGFIIAEGIDSAGAELVDWRIL